MPCGTDETADPGPILCTLGPLEEAPRMRAQRTPTSSLPLSLYCGIAIPDKVLIVIALIARRATIARNCVWSIDVLPFRVRGALLEGFVLVGDGELPGEDLFHAGFDFFGSCHAGIAAFRSARARSLSSRLIRFMLSMIHLGRSCMRPPSRSVSFAAATARLK